MISPANRRMILIAALVLALDQFTKELVLRFLGPREDKVILDGFFKLVNWANTGAAWSSSGTAMESWPGFPRRPWRG